MSAVNLQGFVYGEDRDGARSLGFKLLAPTAASWSAEVEGLARKLHAAAYPENWPPSELFCSVLLENGQRLAGLARYGLHDHTAGQRPGGMEFLGIVGPAALEVSTCRSIAAWLKRRRGEVDDPRTLAGAVSTTGLPQPPALSEPESPLLPLRLANAGTLLITATSPEQPDRHLSVLERSPSPNWQWLPLCGPDFPFDAYAQRGPLIAWTTPRADLAVLLNKPRADTIAPAPRGRSPWALVFAGVLILLLGLNFWAWWAVPQRLPAPPAANSETPAKKVKEAPPPTETRERFAQALYRLAASRTGADFFKNDDALRQRYQRLLETDPELRLDDAKAQAVVAALSQWASYSPERVARLILEEFGDKKGVDPEIVQLISERVRQRLQKELKSSP